MDKIFGKRLAEKRKEKGLFQSDLAEEIKVSQTFISKLELGKKLPSVELLQKLCDILETTPNYLLGYNEK